MTIRIPRGQLHGLSRRRFLSTAAATGAIAGSVVVLARRSIYDAPTLAIALISFGILFRWKLPEPVVIAGAAAAGLVLKSIRL